MVFQMCVVVPVVFGDGVLWFAFPFGCEKGEPPFVGGPQVNHQKGVRVSKTWTSEAGANKTALCRSCTSSAANWLPGRPAPFSGGFCYSANVGDQFSEPRRVHEREDVGGFVYLFVGHSALALSWLFKSGRQAPRRPLRRRRRAPRVRRQLPWLPSAVATAHDVPPARGGLREARHQAGPSFR
jgi:hypothetical protein